MTDEMANLIRDAINAALAGVLIGAVGTILKHDPVRMRADVQIKLLLSADGRIRRPMTPLTDVPVSMVLAGGGTSFIRPQYLPGDMVWITFASWSIDHALRGASDTAFGRQFALESACIVGGVTLDAQTVPEFSLPGLLLGGLGALIQFVGGQIVMTGGGGAVTVGATGLVSAGDVADATGTLAQVRADLAALRGEFDAHVHTETGTTTSTPVIP